MRVRLRRLNRNAPLIPCNAMMFDGQGPKELVRVSLIRGEEEDVQRTVEWLESTADSVRLGEIVADYEAEHVRP